MDAMDFKFVIDGVPYSVKALPFDFNAEKRFKVSYDGSEYIFAYNSDMGRYASIGDDSIAIPDNLEAVLAEKLENYGS